MKKVYVLVVVCLAFACTAAAQTFYWIGSANGSWNNGSNWSLSPGGGAAGDFPQDAADNAIINTNASILLNTSVDLNSLSVAGSSLNVKITGTGATDRNITLHSTSTANPALSIDAGCSLEHSAETDTWFRIVFGANAMGEVNGDWLFSGDIDDNAIASFYLGDAGFNTRLNVNSGGSITIGSKGFIEPNELTGDEYLVFRSGSSIRLLGNGPVVPAANYSPASTIEIRGVTDASVIFEEAGSIGHLTYDCPSQSNGSNHLYLSLLTFTVFGDVNILNTNNNELALVSFNATTGLTSRDAFIKGSLNIQGNSRVAVAHNDGLEFANNLFVDGNVVMNGTSFTLHSGNFISSQPTTLHVKGNIVHSAGTFTSTSTVINEAAHLFVISMAGTNAQTISSHSGTFDNPQSQVTLKINNAAGVTLLSDLAVGRVSFNSPAKGIIHTGSHTLTINNRTAPSVSALPMEAASTLGYIDGKLRRKSSHNEPLLMPVGAGGNYRAVTIVPASSVSSMFEAQYINTDHGGTHTAPVRGVANYYWNVQRVGSGADAAIQLNIPGAIPGALMGHELAVGRFDGSNWISTKGATGMVVSPGTSTSGTVRSSAQGSFGAFTISLESEGALATRLVSFEARNAGKNVADLDWVITDNSTPEKFEILRSDNGRDFIQIGMIEGAEGKRSYRFQDAAMLPADNYYKLRMIDKDGSITFSTIRTLLRSASGVSLVSILPTVVSSSARLRILSHAKGNMQVVVTDINGRIARTQLLQYESGSADIQLNLHDVTPGMYQVTAYIAGEKLGTLRFIKQ